MKKWVLVSFILLMTVAMTLAGCGSSGSGGSSPAGGSANGSGSSGDSGGSGGGSVKAKELVFSHPFPEGDYRAQTYAYFASEVTKRTNGSVKITVHPGAALVKDDQAYQAVSTGTIDISHTSSSYVSPLVPELTFFDVPGSYIPDNWMEIQDAVMPIVQEIIDKDNVKYLFSSYEGETSISLKKGAERITSPDLHGYKLRASGKYITEAVRLWNGQGVTIPLGDVVMSMQTGVVDGVVTGWPNANSLKLYELADVIYLTQINIPWDLTLMNMDVWNSLTDEEKRIFDEVAREASMRSKELSDQNFEAFKKAVAEHGVELVEFTPELRREFVEKAAPIFEDLKNNTTPNGLKLYETLMELQKGR
jgi:TRAP-type C4-dicarboxylate transport system substrate-binding protein